MTQALVLAAGTGSRLRPYTNTQPKTLVPLLGRPILTYQLEVLKNAGITSVTIVNGYLPHQLEALGLPTYTNPLFESTNMVESLMAARPYLEQLQDDLLIIYGDIVYQSSNLATVLNTEADVVLMIDRGWHTLWSTRNEDPLLDAETLKLSPEGYVLELGKKPKDLSEIEGQYTGLIKIQQNKIKELLRFYDQLDQTALYDGKPFQQMYMTSFLQSLIDSGWAVKAALVQHGWLEVDTAEDLHLYQTLHAEGKLSALWSHDV